MSSLFGIGGNGASSGFYEETIDQSLRFDDGNSKLVRVPSSDGNRKKWTTSFWVKRSQQGQLQYLWTAGAHSGNNGIAAIYFNSDDKIHTYFDTTGANPYGGVNSRVYRDTASWYNIVWAVDAVNTVQRIWVNGVEESLSSSLNPPNYAYGMNQAGINQTFGIAGWGGSPNLDGYLANIVHLDGQYLDQSYFGETKKGVWVPKEITGLTFGTNGFHLTFANSSDIGEDISGNNNDFTPTGLTSDDIVPDTPTNNFATFSTYRRYGQYYLPSLTEGALEGASSGNATSIFGNMAINNVVSEGGVYFEVRLTSVDTVRTYVGVVGDNGFNNENASANGAAYSFPIKGMLRPTGGGSPNAYFNTATDGSGSIDLSSHNSTYSAGDIVGVAILSDGKTFFHKNGTYLDDASGNVGNPSTGANPVGTIDLTEGDWVPYVGYASTFNINFGQDGTFGGRETSGNYQDANGIGDFKYAVPTNCLALCASNMAEPAIGPNSATQADDHFNTVLFSGNGSAASVTGVGFKPDWIWAKNRTNAYGHGLWDVLRGVNSELQSNSTAVEITTANRLVSFDADGFSYGDQSNLYVNSTNSVAWNWKAGGDPGNVSGNFIRDGAAFTPSHGTINANKISANTTSGFSIVEFTSTVTGSTSESAAPHTVAHGLGKVPEWVIIKDRDGGSYPHWNVWHQDYQPDTTHLNYHFIGLQSTAAANNAGWSRADTGMTTNLFSIPLYQYTENGKSYIAYVFSGIPGYSKFGGYLPNNNNDTTNIFVYTGFRPAFLLVKYAEGTQEWAIIDNKRDTNNDNATNVLYPNYSNAESADGSNKIDLLSNGFKINSTGSFGYLAGVAYIYAAFAEVPFKYANAR